MRAVPPWHVPGMIVVAEALRSGCCPHCLWMTTATPWNGSRPLQRLSLVCRRGDTERPTAWYAAVATRHSDPRTGQRGGDGEHGFPTMAGRFPRLAHPTANQVPTARVYFPLRKGASNSSWGDAAWALRAKPSHR